MLVFEICFSVALGIGFGFWIHGFAVDAAADISQPYMIIFCWIAGVIFFLAHRSEDKRSVEFEVL